MLFDIKVSYGGDGTEGGPPYYRTRWERVRLKVLCAVAAVVVGGVFTMAAILVQLGVQMPWH